MNAILISTIGAFLFSLLFGQLTSLAIYSGASVYAHDIVLVAGLCTAYVWSAVRKRRITFPYIKPVAIFAAACAVSLLVNAHRLDGIQLVVSSLYLVRWIVYAAVMVLVATRVMRPMAWLVGLFSVGVGLSVAGLLQLILYPSLRNLTYLGWDPHNFRVFSTLLDPNFAGIIFVFTVLLGIYLVKLETKYRRALLVGVAVAAIALLLTFSRSSYLSLIAGLVAYGVLTKKAKSMLVAALVFTIIIVAVPKPGGDVLRLTRIDSSVSRIENSMHGLSLFVRQPVFGHGFNTLRFTNPTQETGVISRAAGGLDNSYVFILATSGAVGLGAFVYLISHIWKATRDVYKKDSDYIIMVWCSTITLFVHSLFVLSLFYAWVMLWMWILAGIVYTKRELTSRNARSV